MKKGLYSEIEPFNTGFLKVSEIHTLYYEEVGNPSGVPVIYLHGGPGGQVGMLSRRYFDPTFYHIILFDQRGCGKSKPIANITDNTTEHLIADMERLRTHLNIEQWLLFGGSWGSTLALAYAIAHSDRVTGIILRGIFLARPFEVQWLYQAGASTVYPDAFEHFLEPIPKEEQHDLVKAYLPRLTTDDDATRIKAAREWSRWEGSISKLIPNPGPSRFESHDDALSISRIECHYFNNNSFFPTENYLLENIKKIKKIKGIIVQGRYDMVCPMRTAWDLHKAWPEAEFNIIPDGGHSITDPNMLQALINATELFKTILSDHK